MKKLFLVKSLITVLLPGLLILSGCTSAVQDPGGASGPETAEEPSGEGTDADDPADPQDPLSSDSGSDDPGATETAAEKTDHSGDPLSFPDAPSSRELTVLMGQGINLGNTMEACNSRDLNTSYPITVYETMWGQPVTTAEMIDAMKDNGFDTIRIPVAWTNTMDFLNGDYTIREDQFLRVKEIIDYAYDNEMYVIINDHWDKGWWGRFGSADPAVREAAMTQYVELWTQIAEYYRDYDEYLIFEGGNEEIGDRLNDVDETISPDSGTLSKDECYDTANTINQTFVDTVRATGGNNTGRFLLIPGYNTDITCTLDPRWKMPEDSAPDRLLLSVHYYTPWFFCGANADSWGTEEETAEMDRLMEDLNAYGKNIGIVIGEYGVLPTSDQALKADSLLWYNRFRENCDRYGYASCLWDRGDFLNKTTHQWIDPALEEFYRRGN